MLRKISNSFEPISEINVTPFVDVLLVLLVIFMITAPLFTKAIDVQLPEEKLRSSENKRQRKLIITINRNGKYFIEGRRHNRQKLLSAIAGWQERSAGKTVFIRGDKRVKYGDVTALTVLLKNNGFQNVGLLVEDKK